MAKTKGMYKCGKCGNLGHNARTCAQAKVAPPAAAPAAAPIEAQAVEEKPDPGPQIPMGETMDLTAARRGPSGRPINAPSPFECPTCLRVGVLVLVELEQGAKQLRCEHCHNKVKVKIILKWGAQPGDKPAVGV